MPRHTPFRIELSDQERVVLESLARSYTLPYWQVTRAQMVLMAADGLRNDQIATGEFRVVLVEEHRAVITAGSVESPLGEVGGEQRRRVRVDRDMPCFAAFAGQRDDRRVLEPDVPDCQIGGLLDPGGGVVEGRQQGRVSPALAG
jgi:hypothetical protein